MLNDRLADVLGRLLPRMRALSGVKLTPAQIAFFHAEGYLILPGLFPSPLAHKLNAHLDALWATRSGQSDQPIDVYFDTPREARILFRNATEEARREPYKLPDLHLQDDLIADTCTAPALAGAIRSLLGARPLVCNSLLFEWGSQQYPHFDTFFMPSKTPEMMAAAWIALDPVTEKNGPLYFYPRSHLIAPYVFSHGQTTAIFAELKTGAARHIKQIVASHRLEPKLFLAAPGDVLIWHAQLLHGGTPIADRARTRRSLVTHYWTDLDYPDEAQRIDRGEERWVLRKRHEYVVDDEVLAEVDAFLSHLEPHAAAEEVPSSFDPRRYLARNQDVLRACMDPWSHYLQHGRQEGRVW
jgi:phytanoyl-CoA hydroxylase